jgi:adenylate cyclase
MTPQVMAQVLGTDLATLDALVGIGALRIRNGRFADEEVPRGRAALAYVQAGVSIEQLARMVEDGFADFDAVDQLFLAPAPLSGRTFAAFCAAHPGHKAMIPRVYTALGMPEPEPDTLTREDEERLVVELIEAWQAIGGDETVVRAARLFGESVRRAIQGWLDLYRETAGTGGGVPLPMPPDVVQARNRAGQRLADLAPGLLVWLEQRHFERVLFETNVAELEAALPILGIGPPREARLPAIAFVDLAGYTAMTERRGDELAVRSAVRLQEVCDTAARQRGGHLVKLLGDGAMLHFGRATEAVAACLEILDRGQADGLELHGGVASGPLIARDGDYFGHTVNVAARLSGLAGPGTVLVTPSVVEAVGDADGLHFEPLPPAKVKGVSDPLEVFRATRRPARDRP